MQVLAGDPSLRGVVRALQFGLLGVQSGKIKLDNMVWPLTLAANTLDQVNANKPASFSWQALVQGQRAKILRSDAVSENSAGARLFRAAAGHEGEQRHPPGRRRPRSCRQISGARAPDRPGADERRPVRHHQRECGAQRLRDHCGRALHPVAGAALVADHPRGVHQLLRSDSRSRRRSAS